MSKDKLFRDVERNLRLVARTGKVIYGVDYVRWALKNKKVKLIMLSSNIPPKIERELKNICESKKIPIFKSKMNNIQLGDACLRPHIVTVLAILDLGMLARRVEEVA